MIASDFKGYREGLDATKFPVAYITKPSKNVLIYKGKILTRLGIKNDGVAPTGSNKIHSAFVWKDAAGGQRHIRCTGQKVQVKHDSKWLTIFESLDSNVTRVYFATWVDNNDSIVHKRLFFSDGSTTLYQWNGAISDVDSFSSDTITLDIDDTCEKQGYDDGSVTTQDVRIFSLDGNGDVDNTEDATYNNDPSSGKTLDLTGTPNHTPVSGDIVVAKPVAFADAVSSNFDIDVVYPFKNHVVAASFSKTELFFSNIETYSLSSGLDFTMPGSGSRTATTAIYFNLDGNITSTIARNNTLWVSDANDWYKITKLNEENAYGLWVDVDKLETAEQKGAYQMAVANHKGDLIYLAQDNTLQRVRTNELTGRDEFALLSDDIDAALERLNKNDVRLKYHERYVHIIFPSDSTMLMLDTVEGFWQAPQNLPVSDITVVDGQKYGHSNAKDETFLLFNGRSDLGSDIEGIIAFGYHPFTERFRYDQFKTFGMSVRFTKSTEVTYNLQYETEGAKADYERKFTASEAKAYSLSEDSSFGSHPWGSRSWGGNDNVEDMFRAFVFDRPASHPFFEFRPIFTVRGSNCEFHLLAWWADNYQSSLRPGDDLYLSR